MLKGGKAHIPPKISEVLDRVLSERALAVFGEVALPFTEIQKIPQARFARLEGLRFKH
jgi:hypothetical protein